MMDEQDFKQKFIVTFLATWVSNHYDDFCARSKHELLNHPPVEDAVFLADKAWAEFQEKGE